MRDFLPRVAAVLKDRTPGEAGDLGPAGEGATLRPASVLIPIFELDGDPGILFLRRGDHLGSHAGQIAFPGGGRNQGEDDLAAALREAHEELALQSDDLELLGRLDTYATITRFQVAPFVARVTRWPVELRPDPAEVAGVITVPVRTLIAPGTLRVIHREVEGGTREINFFVTDDEVIWGATARMLRQLLELALGAPLVPQGEVPLHRVRW